MFVYFELNLNLNLNFQRKIKRKNEKEHVFSLHFISILHKGVSYF
jgi:hypothetical protein